MWAGRSAVAAILALLVLFELAEGGAPGWGGLFRSAKGGSAAEVCEGALVADAPGGKAGQQGPKAAEEKLIRRTTFKAKRSQSRTLEGEARGGPACAPPPCLHAPEVV
jgi:hypothetical protein